MRRPTRRSVVAALVSLALACAGALVATVAIGGVAPASDAADLQEKNAAGPTTTTLQPLQSETFDKGDCVTWRHDTSAEALAHVVRCSSPHLMEMIGVRPLYRTRRFPSTAEWTSFVNASCTAPLARYWNHAVDPLGAYEVTAIIPLQQAWAGGDHRVQCSISSALRGRDGQALPLTGRADANHQARLYPVGTCLGAAQPGAGLSEVDCNASHVVEVTGTADTTNLVDHAPGGEELSGLVAQQCLPQSETYLGRSLDGSLASGQLGLTPESWAAGTRMIDCILGRRSDDGQGFGTLAAPLRSGG